MGWLNVVLLLYGLFNIGMGCIGYFRGHSIISLIAGSVAGLIVLGTLVWYKSNPRAARITALVITIALMGQFAKDTFEKNQLYPAGAIFVPSVIVFLCLLVGHVMGMRAKKARGAKES